MSDAEKMVTEEQTADKSKKFKVFRWADFKEMRDAIRDSMMEIIKNPDSTTTQQIEAAEILIEVAKWDYGRWLS